MFVNGSGQNVQSLEMTFYRCFLPSFSSLDWGVSEKIKMWKVNGRRTPSNGKSSHCLWQGGLKRGGGSRNLYTFLAKVKNDNVLYFIFTHDHLVIYEDRNVTHKCKTLSKPHHFSKGAHKTSLTLPLFYLNSWKSKEKNNE